jgi:hypothetical protein
MALTKEQKDIITMMKKGKSLSPEQGAIAMTVLDSLTVEEEIKEKKEETKEEIKKDEKSLETNAAEEQKVQEKEVEKKDAEKVDPIPTETVESLKQQIKDLQEKLSTEEKPEDTSQIGTVSGGAKNSGGSDRSFGVR